MPELAHQAPIGGNVEVRKWVVVTEPDLKQALADMYRKHALPYLRPSRRRAPTMSSKNASATARCSWPTTWSASRSW